MCTSIYQPSLHAQGNTEASKARGRPPRTKAKAVMGLGVLHHGGWNSHGSAAQPSGAEGLGRRKWERRQLLLRPGRGVRGLRR